MEYTTRPLSNRLWLRTGPRKNSQFSASWSSTLNLLDRELGYLDADHVVIGMDIDESEIRLDGRPRASAHPRTPAVEIAFDSKYGPLIYRCDEYTAGYRGERADAWQHNVRAIALTLEALRAVDRYAASAKGEQYRGYRAIESGTAMATHMDRDTAFGIITTFAGVDEDEPLYGGVLRRAKAAAHPDANDGDRTKWDLLEKALDVLDV